MEAKPSSEKRFALLIDADNVSAKYIKPITDELSKYGTVTIKRIYGDWTLTLHAKWKDALLDNSLTPIQQFSYTTGKNATDSAMIIDAMDILYGGRVDGFCIVSSDSDFTRLASRIRESGLMVIGMGEKKTPAAFRQACDIFTILELLLYASKGDRRDAVQAPELTREQLEEAVCDIVTDNQNNGKSTGLGEVGSRLLKRYPDFDVRSYGTNLLSKLLSEFQRVKITKSGSNVTVELADEGEHVPAASALATSPENVQASEQQSDSQTGKAEEDTKGGEYEGTAPSRRRRRRRTLNTDRDGVDREASATKAPTRLPEDRATNASTQPSEDHAANASTQQSEGRAAKTPSKLSAKRKLKPAATASSRGRGTQSSATASSRGRGTQSSAKASSRGRGAQSSAKASSKSTATKAQRAQTPDEFILQVVSQSGDEGILVSELGKQVRKRYSSFKVREKGYPHLGAYLVDIDGVRVFKKGRETWVAHAG